MLPHPTPFLTELLASLEPSPGALDHLLLDHICYRVESVADYERLRDGLSVENALLAESIIQGRRISTFRMSAPWVYRQRRIELLELPEPKPGRFYPEGYDHVEFVADRPLAAFAGWLEEHLGIDEARLDRSGLSKASNADLRIHLGGGRSVKFHERALDAVIAEELGQET